MAAGGVTRDALMAAVVNAAHKTGLNTDPSTGQPYDAQGQDPNAQGDPNADPNAQQDPNAQGGDPQQQAIWDTFPSTDPDQVQQLASQAQGAQGPDLMQIIEGYLQQADQDKQNFEDMQSQMAQHLMELLGAPSGGQDAQAPDQAVAAPGVGGQGTGL